MSTRRRNHHSSDTPHWNATKAARTACEQRDRFLSDMTSAATFTSFLASQARDIFDARVAQLRLEAV